MERRLSRELMDDPDVDRAALAQSLAYLRWVNARMGGSSALIRRLRKWSVRWPRAGAGVVTLLDVATGSADVPVAARRWALGAGFDLRIVGIDVHEATLAEARRFVAAASERDPRIGEGIELRLADAKGLVESFGAGSFDYVHAALFLHHLPDIEVLTMLRIMDRLAKRGLVWSDLHRSGLHRALARLSTAGKSDIVRHDTVVSFEAGFTRREVEEIAQRVGVAGWMRYRRAPLWYRFTLAGERPGAWELP